MGDSGREAPEGGDIYIYIYICCVCSVAQSCPTLCDPMDCSPPGSTGFSRQEYWSGLPFPPPRDLPDPVFEPMSPVSLIYVYIYLIFFLVWKKLTQHCKAVILQQKKRRRVLGS